MSPSCVPQRMLVHGWRSIHRDDPCRRSLPEGAFFVFSQQDPYGAAWHEIVGSDSRDIAVLRGADTGAAPRRPAPALHYAGGRCLPIASSNGRRCLAFPGCRRPGDSPLRRLRPRRSRGLGPPPRRVSPALCARVIPGNAGELSAKIINNFLSLRGDLLRTFAAEIPPPGHFKHSYNILLRPFVSHPFRRSADASGQRADIRSCRIWRFQRC